MSDFDRRWERLAAAARQAPSLEPAEPGPVWVQRTARRGLLARPAPVGRGPERLAWAGLGTLAAAAAAVVLLWPGPLGSTATAAAAWVSSLPREIPHAPRLPRGPAIPRPALPGAQATVAAVSRWSELSLTSPSSHPQNGTP